MDPSGGNQQSAPAMKHIMTVPEKIELTSTGAYPSPPRAGASSGQRAGDGYRAMRVPDKIMLESGGGEMEGESETGGGRAFIQQQNQRREPPLDPPPPTNVEHPQSSAMAKDTQTALNVLDHRVTAIEGQLRGLQQAVLQGRGGGGGRREGSRVWYALTFAGWLMVPLVVVFMFHYRKTAH